jgi:NAD+ synthase (glutamine-hydrolysing)
MRIAVAQLDPVVGDFEGNLSKIREAYLRACQAQARLLLTPELSLCGYPPYDLIERPEMMIRTEQALLELAKMTAGKKTAVAVGHIGLNEGKATGRPHTNRVSILDGGRIVHHQDKTLLPTYDVFDEARYFEPATECRWLELEGKRIGVGICEDLWSDDLVFGRRLYERAPVDQYAGQNLDILISLSASPYDYGKRERRERVHADLARRLHVPIVYVNQACANDELLFDGGSFALGRDGSVFGRLPFFKTGFMVADVAKSKAEGENLSGVPEEIEIMTEGLVTGIGDYFKRSGSKKAVLGLSGGIDSAVTACLAVRALGRENVTGVAMPSQHSSTHSLADAETLARTLGIRFEVRPIKFMFSAASRELGEGRQPLAPIALENMQSRLRGLTLMTISNHDGSLVLCTSNKSEAAVGYGTLYGDMIGALAPIGDVLKTRVYEIARFINRAWGEWIPESSITKAPSAELRPDQKDQDSLPPYDLLDRVIHRYVEEGKSVADIRKELAAPLNQHRPIESKKDRDVLDELIQRIENAEYKRRQAPPTLKVSRKAFGVGRRMPIAKKW